MEPLEIDWLNIDSRFIRDDLFECINAPKWVDFSSPDDAIDDEAWFCRPDCLHPKNAEDYKVKRHQRPASSSDIPEMEGKLRRDGALKRRGGLSSALSSLPNNHKSGKKFRDDAENENPNSSAAASPVSAIRLLKDSIKSSAEKKKKNVKDQQDLVQDLIKPDGLVGPRKAVEEERPTVGGAGRLRSTVSARNLLGGGTEIVSQVAEFWAEVKRLALSATVEREKKVVANEKEKEPLIELEAEEKEALVEEVHCKEEIEEKKGSYSNLFSTPGAWKKTRQRRVGNGDGENIAINACSSDDHKGCLGHSQVRSCPPTPQRFSSPSNRLKHAKSTTGPSPLKSKLERGVLLEVKPPKKLGIMKEESEENNEAKAHTVAANSSEEAKPLDVLWFFKPCTYLVR